MAGGMIDDQTMTRVTTLTSVVPGQTPSWMGLYAHLEKDRSEEREQTEWEVGDDARRILVVGKMAFGHRPKGVEGPSIEANLIAPVSRPPMIAVKKR